MKRLVLLVLLVPVLLSSCFIFGPGYEDWNGELEGIEGLYDITVSQSGSDLIIEIQVNDAAYGELLAELDEGEDFVPPSELFFWMAPVFEDWNPYESYYYMYPVARKRITADFFTDSNNDGNNENPLVTVIVKLEKLAKDWNINWLTEANFGGSSYYGGQNDQYGEMTGVYVFAADNYMEFWDLQFTDIPLKEGGKQNVKFEKSRPIGVGYSLADSILGEYWNPVTWTQEGLYISDYYIFGGIPLEITLKLSENESFGAPISIPSYWEYYNLTLENAYSVSSDQKELVWRVIYEKSDYYGVELEGSTGNYTIHIPGPSSSWQTFSAPYGWWYSVNFEYKGYANRVFFTDFENDWNLTGDVGGVLTKIPVTNGNNWAIGDLPSTVKRIGSISGKVLGLTAGGEISGNYDYNRNDIIEFPSYNYFDELYYYENANSVYVVFDLYKNLSMDWQDTLYLEIERKTYDYNNNPIGTDWLIINSWTGPVDAYYNYGWEKVQLQVYNIGDYSYYNWSDISGEQRIRLRFESNSWSNAEGVYIDNLQVLLVGEGGAY